MNTPTPTDQPDPAPGEMPTAASILTSMTKADLLRIEALLVQTQALVARMNFTVEEARRDNATGAWQRNHSAVLRATEEQYVAVKAEMNRLLEPRSAPVQPPISRQIESAARCHPEVWAQIHGVLISPDKHTYPSPPESAFVTPPVETIAPLPPGAALVRKPKAVAESEALHVLNSAIDVYQCSERPGAPKLILSTTKEVWDAVIDGAKKNGNWVQDTRCAGITEYRGCQVVIHRRYGLWAEAVPPTEAKPEPAGDGAISASSLKAILAAADGWTTNVCFHHIGPVFCQAPDHSHGTTDHPFVSLATLLGSVVELASARVMQSADIAREALAAPGEVAKLRHELGIVSNTRHAANARALKYEAERDSARRSYQVLVECLWEYGVTIQCCALDKHWVKGWFPMASKGVSVETKWDWERWSYRVPMEQFANARLQFEKAIEKVLALTAERDQLLEIMWLDGPGEPHETIEQCKAQFAAGWVRKTQLDEAEKTIAAEQRGAEKGRAESAPESYRLLETGEIIQEGDQFLPALGGNWRDVSVTSGKVLYAGKYRRPITGGAGLHEAATVSQAPAEPELCQTCGEPLTLDCGPTGDQSNMICQPCIETEAALAFVKRFTKHVSSTEGNAFAAQGCFEVMLRTKAQDEENIEAMFNQVKALAKERDELTKMVAEARAQSGLLKAEKERDELREKFAQARQWNKLAEMELANLRELSTADARDVARLKTQFQQLTRLELAFQKAVGTQPEAAQP